MKRDLIYISLLGLQAKHPVPFFLGKILLNSDTIPGDLRLILQRENTVSHQVLISDTKFVHHLLS